MGVQPQKGTKDATRTKNDGVLLIHSSLPLIRDIREIRGLFFVFLFARFVPLCARIESVAVVDPVHIGMRQ
jgi:hypothetical protein